MPIQKTDVKSVMTKSNLPAADYSVNPYVGCSNACEAKYQRQHRAQICGYEAILRFC